LTSVTSEDTYEGDFESRRIITWQFDFTVKGYLFGPVKKFKYITKTDVNFIDDNEPIEKAIITTAQSEGDANFEATTTIISPNGYTE